MGLLGHAAISRGELEVTKEWDALGQDDISLVVTDACSDDHLATLAGALASLPLVTGGSGLARYLPAAYRASGLLTSDEFVPSIPQVTGRSLIVAGSCSAATNAQVKWMHDKCPSLRIDVAAVIADKAAELAKIKAWAETADPRQPLLVSSSDSPRSVAQLQDRFGVETAATAIEGFLASVATLLVDQLDIRRLVLAGGETSGAIVRELGIRSLHIGPEICAGVPWTETGDANRPLALALKSGNFGGEDFFQAALQMLP